MAAALLYVSFQGANFFCRDVVQHNLLVTVFLSRSLLQLKLNMTSVFLIWALKKKKIPPASTFAAQTYFLSSITEIPDFLDVLEVSRVMTDIWEQQKKASANPKAWRNGIMKCVEMHEKVWDFVHMVPASHLFGPSVPNPSMKYALAEQILVWGKYYFYLTIKHLYFF